jgi:hypothetical protein
MSQHSHFGNDQTPQQALDMRFLWVLFPTNCLKYVAQKINNEDLKLIVEDCVGHQVLQLGDAAADAAPNNIALVIFVCLEIKEILF